MSLNIKGSILIFKRIISFQSRSLSLTTNFNANKKCEKLIEELDDVPVVLVNDEDLAVKEAEIEVKRNKSRLSPAHRNMLQGKLPYNESQSWIHETVKYKRMMYGRYGEKSGVNPRICFPTEKETIERNEYERVAYPKALKEMIDLDKKDKQEQLLKIQLREEDITKKLTKLEQWKTDLNKKVAKKEADAKSAKDRKDRIVEEVRRHFGFKVDVRDERFKELLEQKEKEDRKQQKEAKRRAKENKMIEKLQEKQNELAEEKTT